MTHLVFNPHHHKYCKLFIQKCFITSNNIYSAIEDNSHDSDLYSDGVLETVPIFYIVMINESSFAVAAAATVLVTAVYLMRMTPQ